MSDEHQTIICQRCGCGFVLTSTYRDFLARRGVKVAVPVQCMRCFLQAGPLPKQRGQVKWFSPRKGYGFITTVEDKDVFFHQNELVVGNGNLPHEGQGTRFHLRHSVKGSEAVNVELVEG
jgi:CspA family cold shock protein